MNRICVIGCGYVGLVSGVGLAEFHNEILCTDTDSVRIENLKKMIMPFSEPGLLKLVKKNSDMGRLSFVNDIKPMLINCDAVMIAVQTPQSVDGSADLSYLMVAASEIAKHIKKAVVVIIKSTVPIGTAKKVKKLINSILADRDVGFSVEVVSNPEFLQEGSAVDTFLNPDRIVLGCKDGGVASKLMEEIYTIPAAAGVPIIKCSNETAETIKYASNAFLAMKISYINQMALLCEKTGADIKTVAKALGSDARINPKFLNPGPGYGGSCFPKDTRALVKMGEIHGLDLSMIRAAYESNAVHKTILAEKAVRILKENGGKTLAVWGLSFKAGSSDMRNSPVLDILPVIIKGGIKIKAYDPEAMDGAKIHLAKYMDDIELCKTQEDTLSNSDALMILTEWECFKKANLTETAFRLNKKILLDYRNIYDAAEAEKTGFLYYGVGR